MLSPTVSLNNTIKMPILGFGVWRIQPGKETEAAVTTALETGYRHIDTAQYYANEESVGNAIKASGLKREEFFITSKVAINNFGYNNVLQSVEISLKKLQVDYCDLFLLHFPIEKLRIESYHALERLYKTGSLKAIGVSNFTINHLKELLTKTEILPTVNQVEFTPFLYQKKLHEFCRENKIQLEAYSPLAKGKRMDDERLQKIAAKHNKTPAQVLIRWQIEHDIVVIPKSVTPVRIKENFDVFDFKLDQEDMKTLDNMNEDQRYSWNPEDKLQVKAFSNGIIRKIIPAARKAVDRVTNL